MKTDALIEMLARGPVAAGSWRPALRLALAASAGLLIAIVAMLAGLGLRPDIAVAAALPMFWLKLALPLAIAAAALAATSRLARPGDMAGATAAVIAAVLLGLWAMAARDLAAAPAGGRLAAVAGQSAGSCVAGIAVLSLPLMIALFLALRGLAPTRPALAGLAAGALAGGSGAAAYALHCTEMAVPFLATWYVLGMAIPAAVGAWLGPRLLRWS